jgi:UDP:flavonoid glycosyltransferase YjiC (YdhE family)
MSEALFLKKPMFVNPLKGHFEQTLNALILQEQKLGEFSEEFTRENIENFLKNAKAYKKNISRYKMNPNEAFATTERILKHLCPED